MHHSQTNTHKQLVGHNDGGVAGVHVDFDHVSVPRAIQQLIVWRPSRERLIIEQRKQDIWPMS